MHIASVIKPTILLRKIFSEPNLYDVAKYVTRKLNPSNEKNRCNLDCSEIDGALNTIKIPKILIKYLVLTFIVSPNNIFKIVFHNLDLPLIGYHVYSNMS